MALGIPAASAEAAPSSRCPEGYVCFWSGDNFTGTMTVYENPKNHTCSTITPGVRTVYNNDDQAWDFYKDSSCRAFGYHLEPGEYETGQRVSSWT